MAGSGKARPAEKQEAVSGDNPAAPTKRKMSGKTLVLFIILPAVLLLGGGGAVAMLLLGGAAPTSAQVAEDKAPKSEEPDEQKASPAPSGDKNSEGSETGSAETGGQPDLGYALVCANEDPCYYVMPKLIVNLRSPEGKRSPFMELELTLESTSAATFNRLPELMPRLKNQLTSFLRELRVEDLGGSTGTWRLRRELLSRFNLALEPDQIDAVLIESMLVQ